MRLPGQGVAFESPTEHRGSEHLGIHSCTLESSMPKIKGGREVRKPKQVKTPKTADANPIALKIDGTAKKGK
jgi:hypothetical protein